MVRASLVKRRYIKYPAFFSSFNMHRLVHELVSSFHSHSVANSRRNGTGICEFLWPLLSR